MALNFSIMKKLLVIFLIIVSGCDLFKLREPEPPGSGMSWIEPDSAYKVLRNMEFSYQYFMLDNYMECFDSANFEFYADESLLNGPHAYLYRDWDYNKEKMQTEILFSSYLKPQSPPFLLIIRDSIQEFGDSARLFARYRLVVELRDSRELEARGSSIFLAVKDASSGLWSISRWWDIKTTPSTLSWAEIKALDF